MIKAKLIKCNDGEHLLDLTVGKVYEGWLDDEDSTFTVDKDDRGDQNELYEGEYEIVE